MTPRVTVRCQRSEIKIEHGKQVPNSCHATMGCWTELYQESLVYSLAKMCGDCHPLAILCGSNQGSRKAINNSSSKKRYAILPKPSTMASFSCQYPREGAIFEAVYFLRDIDNGQIVQKQRSLVTSLHNAIRESGMLAASRPAISHSACIKPCTYPITVAVPHVLLSGSSGYTSPSRPTPVEQRTYPAHKLSLQLRAHPAVLSSGTDTPSVSKRNGHCKSCLNS